jgi:hypothetical protein
MARWFFLSGCLLLLAGFTHGSISGGGSTPVISTVSCFTGSPAANTQAVVSPAGSACGVASNTPTSWSISGCSSNLSIDNSGNVTVNTTGAAAWTANNTSTVVSCSPTITATNGSGSGNATITVNVYADGSTNAPTATVQQASLLNGYHAGGAGSGRVRGNSYQPPWAVAGIDYAVGIPSGTTLTDPLTGSLPTGCGRNTTSHQITCTGAVSPTFNGWDFSLENGWQLICSVTSGTMTVTNSNFAIGTNGNAMLVATNGSGCNLLLTYSQLNANGLNDNSNGTNINFNASGTFTAQYNYFLNAAGDFIDLGAGGTQLIEFNLFQNAGQLAGTHPDWLQMAGGTTYTMNFIYNTLYQTAVNNTQGPQGVEDIARSGTVVGSNEMARNTVVTLSNAQVSYDFSVGVASLAGTVSTHDNFVDLSGTTAFMHATSTCASTCPGGGTSTASNNTNMVTGSAISNNWN